MIWLQNRSKIRYRIFSLRLEANLTVTSPTGATSSDLSSFETSVGGAAQAIQSDPTSFRSAVATELSNVLPIVVSASDIGAPAVATPGITIANAQCDTLTFGSCTSCAFRRRATVTDLSVTSSLAGSCVAINLF